MVKCPSCETEIDIEFGMVNCAKCDAVFMVDFDGNIQEDAPIEEEDGAEPEPVLAAVEEVSVVVEDSNSLFEEPVSSSTDEDEPSEEVEEAWATLPDEDATEDEEETGFAAVDLSVDEEPVNTVIDFPEPEPVDNDLDTFDNDTEEEVVVKAPKEEDPDDPLGVTEFDQTDVSQLPEGPYYYDLLISGLDTISIKRDVIGQLGDRRFGWNQEDLKRGIKNGELLLESLNPIKAVVAVMKLQSLDVDISWTQKLFTDESLVESDEELEE